MLTRTSRAGCAAAAMLLTSAATASVTERDDLIAVFEQHNLSGAFAMLDVARDETIVVDAERAARRFVPASTFKIANSLIALETGAVESVDEVLPYGGEPQRFEAWEQDMSMRQAMPLSNVPVYQGIARRVGLERMREMLQRIDYGNHETGEVIDRFWLDGPLEISAIEQTRFLARLATGTLPLSGSTQAAVREMLLVEEIDDARVYGKTGWKFDTGTGWFVGWVERGDAVHTFALNIDMPEEEQAKLRVPLSMQLLRETGVLPPS